MIRSAGFDVHRLRPESSAGYQLALALRRFGVDLVLDVGANTGQFGAELRSFAYAGEIVSFEPLARAHDALSRRAAGDSKWRVHPRTAIGDREGTVEINIAGNLFSSSILPMLDAHSSAARGSGYVGIEETSITTLDSVAPPYLARADSPFLKIDTQGFEKHVLDGARATLSSVRGLQCEVSLVPLYDGQSLWREIFDRLEGEGFTLWAIQPAFADPRDGRTLQLDATWFRT